MQWLCTKGISHPISSHTALSEARNFAYAQIRILLGKFLAPYEALQGRAHSATGSSMEALTKWTGSAWLMALHPSHTPLPQPCSPLRYHLQLLLSHSPLPGLQHHNQYEQQFLPGQTRTDWDRLESNYQSSSVGGLGRKDGQTAGSSSPCSQNSCSLRTSPSHINTPCFRIRMRSQMHSD